MQDDEDEENESFSCCSRRRRRRNKQATHYRCVHMITDNVGRKERISARETEEAKCLYVVSMK